MYYSRKRILWLHWDQGQILTISNISHKAINKKSSVCTWFLFLQPDFKFSRLEVVFATGSYVIETVGVMRDWKPVQREVAPRVYVQGHLNLQWSHLSSLDIKTWSEHLAVDQCCVDLAMLVVYSEVRKHIVICHVFCPGLSLGHSQYWISRLWNIRSLTRFGIKCGYQMV